MPEYQSFRFKLKKKFQVLSAEKLAPPCSDSTTYIHSSASIRLVLSAHHDAKKQSSHQLLTSDACNRYLISDQWTEFSWTEKKPRSSAWEERGKVKESTIPHFGRRKNRSGFWNKTRWLQGQEHMIRHTVPSPGCPTLPRGCLFSS